MTDQMVKENIFTLMGPTTMATGSRINTMGLARNSGPTWQSSKVSTGTGKSTVMADSPGLTAVVLMVIS